MTEAATWLAIIISAASLAVAATSVAITVRWNHKAERKQEAQAAELEDLKRQQQLAELRQIIQGLLVKWRNSNLSHRYAVTDDNWRALLDGVKGWRRGLDVAQTGLLAYTDKGKTRPFFLLERTVEAARSFERVVEPIVEQWESRPKEVDPYQEKLKVQDAILKLQAEFREALDALEDVEDRDLTAPMQRSP